MILSESWKSHALKLKCPLSWLPSGGAKVQSALCFLQVLETWIPWLGTLFHLQSQHCISLTRFLHHISSSDLLPLTCKDPCDYIASTYMIQENPLISRFLTYSYLQGTPHSQIIGVRTMDICKGYYSAYLPNLIRKVHEATAVRGLKKGCRTEVTHQVLWL